MGAVCCGTEVTNCNNETKVVQLSNEAWPNYWPTFACPACHNQSLLPPLAPFNLATKSASCQWSLRYVLFPMRL